VIGGATEASARTATYARLAQRLPAGARDEDLRRLAAPALEFAEHVPALAQALELGIGESLTAGVLLVPNHDLLLKSSALAWVTPRMVPHHDGPPAVQRTARQLTAAAAEVGSAVRQAQRQLHRHRTGRDDPQRAVATAVQHAGLARSQLRAALNQRLSEQPTVVSAALPTHPRLAPHRPNRGART
jgi:hypothetical protein